MDDTVLSRKRKLSEANEEPPAKFLIEDDSAVSLLSLSDEILLEIFKFLDGNSVYALGESCKRLQNLISDRRLWRQIDLTTKQLTYSDILKRIKYINHETSSIRVRGLTGMYPRQNWSNITITTFLLNEIAATCPIIDTLEVHQGFINVKKVSIADFPSKLRKLTFSKCSIEFATTPNIFFTRMEIHMRNLEELSLEDCSWFETHDLIMFSKLPNLKKLVLKGCYSLKDCVPYGSIAARFGFKKLEHLDIRNTPVSDSDIQCFNITTSLKELLLECPEHLREGPDGAFREHPPSNSFSMPPRRRRILPQPENNGENFIHVILQDRSVLNVNPTTHAVVGNQNGESSNAGNGSNEENPRLPTNRLIARALCFERMYAPPFSPPRVLLISDRGVCCFGSPRNPVQEGVIWIRAEARSPDTNLEKLVLRYYKLVTDTSLEHLVQCAPNLVYIDLTGTSVTKQGVDIFTAAKPNCRVISDHYAD